MNKKFHHSTLLHLITLCIGWTLLYADRTALYPLLSIIGEDFGLTSTQLGAITSSYFLIYVIMQIPSGIFSDKVGKKRLLIWMYFIAGIGLLCFGFFARSYTLLLIFTALHGLGASAYYPCAYGIMLDSVPEGNWATGAAIVNLGMSFGLIIGLAASGPLYLHFKSYKGIFIALAFLTLLTALLFKYSLPDPQPTNSEDKPFPLFTVIKNKNLAFINIAQFCALYGYWVAVIWGSTFFHTERGISMELSGLFVAIVGISALLPSLLVGKISDKLGRRKIALLLFPLGALTIFIMAYARSITSIILALIAYGIVGKSSWNPIAIAWTGEHATHLNKDALGTATGIFNFSGMMSSVFTPVITGLIKDITGSLVTAFYIAAIISLMGGFFVLFIREKPGTPETMRGSKGVDV